MAEDLKDRFVRYVDELHAKLSPQDRAQCLVRYLASHDIADLLPFEEYSSGYLIHKDGLERYFATDRPDALSTRAAVVALQPVAEIAIELSLKRSRIEGETAAAGKHLTEVEELERKCEQLRGRLQLMSRGAWRGVIFVLLLAAAIAASAWAVKTAPTAETKVSIEYNVGEIIAAILGGTGAAAAGLAYAAKTLRGREEE